MELVRMVTNSAIIHTEWKLYEMITNHQYDNQYFKSPKCNKSNRRTLTSNRFIASSLSRSSIRPASDFVFFFLFIALIAQSDLTGPKESQVGRYGTSVLVNRLPWEQNTPERVIRPMRRSNDRSRTTNHPVGTSIWSCHFICSRLVSSGHFFFFLFFPFLFDSADQIIWRIQSYLISVSHAM